LVEIQRAETKAVAAGWREIGALALDRKDRGEMTTAEVLPVYEEAQRLDPEDSWGWVVLRRLYQDAGHLPDARRAAQEALDRAQGDRDRSVASSGLGDVEVAAGDLEAARRRFQQSLEIGQSLAEANPSSAAAQRDLIVSHAKLASLPGGGRHWVEALKIAEKLQREDRLAPRDAWMIDYLRQRAAAVREQP
ncbi:MAG: hypothetical protein V3T83_11280, partial [Acidobacteriota bacterium]